MEYKISRRIDLLVAAGDNLASRLAAAMFVILLFINIEKETAEAKEGLAIRASEE